MDENKNLQAETVGEEQLEDVTGGNDDDKNSNCFFESDNPPVHKVEAGVVKVKCKSRCNKGAINNCGCHGTTRCIDKWHIAVHFAGEIWLPSPTNKNNHSGERKAIRGLKI